MSNNNEQNGRQLPLSQHAAPPSDARLRHVTISDQQINRKFCRDFIWGICTLGSKCKFRHELEFESMKATLKFCHDHQNNPEGCTRADCTYLHTSIDEENLFFATGQIPKDLADRYAAMSSFNVAPDGVQAMYDYMGQPPPPPPSTNVPPPRMMPPMFAAPLPPLLLPPPPPPPPVRPSAPAYFAPAPPQTPEVFSQPTSPIPKEFDSSVPPPDRATSVFKRPAETCEVGPNKSRKLDASNVDEICESCVQRELRIKVYCKEMQKLECENKLQSFIYEKKSDEYDVATALLKSMLGPQAFLIIEEYVEGSTQVTQLNEFLAQINQNQSFASSPSSSVEVDGLSILQQGSLTRLNTINSSTSNFRNAITESWQNGFSNSLLSTPDRTQSTDSRTNELLSSELNRPSSSNINACGINGLSLLNGQKLNSSTSATTVQNNRYMGTGVPRTFAASPGVVAASTSHAVVPGHLPAAAPAAPPAAYLPYQPAVPPPPRPYYPTSYPPCTTSMPFTLPPFNNTPVRVGPSPQAPVRPPTSAPPLPKTQQ